jgi:hypothetical protein
MDGLEATHSVARPRVESTDVPKIYFVLGTRSDA